MSLERIPEDNWPGNGGEGDARKRESKKKGGPSSTPSSSGKRRKDREIRTPTPSKEVEEECREGNVTPGVIKVKIKRLESRIKQIRKVETSPSPGGKGRLRKGQESNRKGTGKNVSAIIRILEEQGVGHKTPKSLPRVRRQATAANTSGLRAPSLAVGKTPSNHKGPRNKEGREGSGRKAGKEKGAGPTFLERWLTASGGTQKVSLEADRGKDC